MNNLYLLIAGLVLVVASVVGMATQGPHDGLASQMYGHEVCGEYSAGHGTMSHRGFAGAMGSHNGAMMGDHTLFMDQNCTDDGDS